jgi:hypothetical protein
VFVFFCGKELGKKKLGTALAILKFISLYIGNFLKKSSGIRYKKCSKVLEEVAPAGLGMLIKLCKVFLV